MKKLFCDVAVIVGHLCGEVCAVGPEFLSLLFIFYCFIYYYFIIIIIICATE